MSGRHRKETTDDPENKSGSKSEVADGNGRGAHVEQRSDDDFGAGETGAHRD
ncbi:MAG: hypothetical protein ACRDUX_41230 [Mycobacterium sp.]